MSKKAKSNSPESWETAQNADDYVNLPSGFAPLWKPEKDDVIFFRPDKVTLFKIKAKAKGKKGDIKKQNYAIEGTFLGGETLHFFSGATAVAVKAGDRVSVGSSFNMIGEDKLITEDGELSKMSEQILKSGKAFRLIFKGKVKTGNEARSVNLFDIGVPKEFRR